MTTGPARPCSGPARGLPFLAAGDTCWKVTHAGRAAVLVDAANYFQALRSSLLGAERSIFIVSWELHSRTRLRGEAAPNDGAPEELGALLKWLLRRKRHLRIRILLWDHVVFYAVERELFPRWIFGWHKPRRVDIVLDSHLPFEASHHEKLVVIDDSVAYCGGIDLTLRRWDTEDHCPDEPRRCDPDKKPYRAVHDVQLVVDGEAAAALATRVRTRWELAGGKPVPPVRAGTDPWPRQVKPDFEWVPVGIARTIARVEADDDEVREVECSTARAIECAEQLIYIENQYVTAKAAIEALVARMREKPGLEVLIVTSRNLDGWLESESMGIGRQQFMAAFDGPDLASRIHFVYPFVRGGADMDDEVPVHIHAKVLIVDDRFLRVGSSNLNNRSMGLDTECDLALEATGSAHRKAIAAIRNRLIGEHWGLDPAEVSRVLVPGLPAWDALAKCPSTPMPAAHGQVGQRGVAPVERKPEWEAKPIIVHLGDPEGVVTAERFVREITGVSHRRLITKYAWPAVVVILLVAAAIILHRYLPSGSGLTDQVSGLMDAWRGSAWRVPMVLAAFVAGSVVSFPIIVLIGATILALGPASGFACATLGMFLAAATTFGIGRRIGHKPLHRFMGHKAHILERRLQGRAIASVALIRKVPMAPFSIVNMVIGASGIPFRDFLIGTAIGMVPGIAAFAVVGDRAFDVWRNPTPLNVTLSVLAVALWIGVVVATQYLVNRYAGK